MHVIPLSRASLRPLESDPLRRVSSLLAQMTLSEKIAQMTLVSRTAFEPRSRRGWSDLLRSGRRNEADLTTYGIGGLFSGGGGYPADNSPRGWLEMVNGYQQRALASRHGIPLLYGVDAVHGHALLRGATVFPHNIGLGATGDPDLVEEIGRITATELTATGVSWNFAPCLAVARDIRWGRTYESYSEDPVTVGTLGAAFVRGLQSPEGANGHGPSSVLATVKHFVGDGGTRWGSATTGSRRIDQGVTDVDEATLRRLHLAPYACALDAGAGCVMASYSSWGGTRIHASHRLLTDVLRGELGFDGFIVSDWNGVDQISRDPVEAVTLCVNAGIDMVMIHRDYGRFFRAMTQAVTQERVRIERLDDAVRRILTTKHRLGLFDRPLASPERLDLVGADEHRAVARDAVRKSLVLLAARDGVLPAAKNASHIRVAGAAAHDLGIQCGGWTIEWQGRAGPLTEGTTILEGIRDAVSPASRVEYDALGEFPSGNGNRSRVPLGIAVVGEMPYAEFHGDREDLDLSAVDLAMLERMRRHCERLVVVIVSGRPLRITEHVERWDAVIAAWLPGSEGAGIADVVFGDRPFTGRLPFTWPRTMATVPARGGTVRAAGALFRCGHGLTVSRDDGAIVRL